MKVFAVVFGSTTCAGCRSLHPTMEKLVKLGSLYGVNFKNIDESKANEAEADALGVVTLPSVFLYKVPEGRGNKFKLLGSFVGNHGFVWVSNFIEDCKAREGLKK